MKLIILTAVLTVAMAITPPDITGTTPPAIDCPRYLCNGRNDGNYQYSYSGASVNVHTFYNPHYFVQCVGGIAYCQACWPLSLEYSPRCNQCLYHENDACITTEKWHPVATFHCPDICPQRGYEFDGNIEDPQNHHHYVGCWKGVTVGCVACPSGLLFNEHENACLYEGIYVTEPTYQK